MTPSPSARERVGVRVAPEWSPFAVAISRYFIGECGDGFKMMDFISSRIGVALPRKACHSGSCITFPRTAARSLRSLYAQPRRATRLAQG